MVYRLAIVRILLAILTLTAAVAPARADIYECVDPSGTKRFTNIASEAKGCKRLSIDPPAPASAPAAPGTQQPRPPKVSTPSHFPRVDRALQQERDNDRRRILENELGNEEKLLAQARKELSEQEAVRLGTEKNYQRVLERLEPYQKKVKLHEDNVANLKREISKVR